MLENFLLRIKLATSEEQLKEISYNAYVSQYITPKQENLISCLAIYKGAILRGETKEQLANCANVLKIPAKYIKMIKWANE